MAEEHDLSDPGFEPTDEQLTGLSVRAFAGVRSAHELMLRELRAQIAVAREQVLRRLADRASRTPDT